MSDSEYFYEEDVTEAFIVKRTMIRRGGRAFSCDYASSAYDNLFSMVCNGAAQLLVTCIGRIRRNQLEGQLGMVDFGDGLGVQAVTALHNIVQRWGHTPTHTTCTFSGRRFHESFLVDFPDLRVPARKIKPLEISINGTSISWEYGLDIARGQFGTAEHSKPPTSSSENYHVFRAVPLEYQYSAGTQVAMTVFTKQMATIQNSRMPRDANVNLVDVYGAADELSIYTGEITHVGHHFFAHNINSYRGCSGAVIFLLNGEYAGQCIGVHIGSPPEIEPSVNLAIKIHETPVFVGSSMSRP